MPKHVVIGSGTSLDAAVDQFRENLQGIGLTGNPTQQVVEVILGQQKKCGKGTGPDYETALANAMKKARTDDARLREYTQYVTIKGTYDGKPCPTADSAATPCSEPAAQPSGSCYESRLGTITDLF